MFKKNINVLYIFIIIFLISQISNSIEILSSTIVKKQVNVLGVDLSYALIDIEFDKELYSYDSLGCPNFNCTVPTSTTVDCSCDYTSTNTSDCPKTLPPSCGKQCSRFEFGDVDICQTKWEKLDQNNKTYTYTTSEDMFFRFKADSFDCKGIFMKVIAIDGYGQSYIGATPTSDYSRYSSGFSPQRNMLFNICPSDNWDPKDHYTITKSWTRDTYFIRISPTTPSFTFQIQLNTNDVPEDKIDTSKCPVVSVYHTCVTAGEVVYGKTVSNLIPEYYSFTVLESGFHYFNFPSIYQSASIYMSESVQYPTSSDSTWRLSQDYENNLVLKLDQGSIIYITVHPTYATDFTFSITTKGNKYGYSLASMPSVESGALALVASSRLILPNNTGHFDSASYSIDNKFSVIYPQTDINPLWPVPSFFFELNKFDYKKITNNIIGSSFNSFKPKSYQAALILSSSSGNSNKVVNGEFEIIANSKLQLLSNFFDENDVPFDFLVGFTVKETTCNNSRFNQVLDLLVNIEKTLFNVSDIDELNNDRYSLDMLTISDSWTGCGNSALKLLDMQSIVEVVSVKTCKYIEDVDPEYDFDPCCDSDAAYYQCCNPSPVSVTVSQYVQVNKSLVQDQCFSLDCTSSVLSEYANSIAGIDACSVPDTLPTKLELHSTNVLRECKSVLVAPSCNSDNDCQSYGGKCNFFSRTCLPDFQVIDKKYIHCVLDNLSPGTLYSLLGGSTNVNDAVVNQVYNDSLIQDCIGYNDIRDRSTYVWSTGKDTVTDDCYFTEDCLDESCLTNHDTCIDSMYTDWEFRLVSHVDNCSSWGVCPQLQCSNSASVIIDGTSMSCKDACENIDVLPNYCGYCTNNETKCHVVPSLTTQAACEDQPICLLPNGNSLPNLDETQCQSKGECSVPCSYQCASNLDGKIDNVCVITGNNETECNEMNIPTPGVTQWSSDASACIYLLAADNISCSGQSYTWINCQSKNASNGECVGPLDNLFICGLNPIACTTEQECLAVGTCSDEFYFKPEESNQLYPFGMGKCLFKHAYYQFGITCNGGIQNDSPNGCYSHIPQNLTQSECEDVDGVWWIPARNKDDCTSQEGCRFLETVSLVTNIPLNYHFNEMNRSFCEGCFDTFNKWTNKFQWSSAKWLPGVYKTTKWIKNEFVENRVTAALSYQKFYKSVMKSTRAQVADLFRSEAYCRMERLQSNLNSITCSCSGDGGSKCFTSSTPLLGQTKPCSGANSSFIFNYGSIEFTNDSISQSCQSLSISQISREIYTSTVSESLSSNFVSYKKPDNFGVLNSKGAIIGTLLGDGIMIKSQDGIKTATICLVYKVNNQNKYPVLDFAVQLDNESIPTPLELNSSLIHPNDTNSQLCTEISNIPRGSPIYFPINRMTDWTNEIKESFDKTAKGLMYTLASLFLIIALWGTYELVLVGIAQYKSVKKNFQLTHLLIAIVTLFITIRAIYFFIMPSGSLSDSPVSDYVLVVLPTFIYFSAFMCLITLWYVIVFMVLKKNKSAENLSTSLYRLVIIVNAILYLLFIAIVLVFQYTKSNPTNDCGSRIVIPMESSTPQRVVSIVYAVIQGAISLIIGAAFIYLGGRLYLAMRVSNIKVGSKSNHQRKVFTLTIACSVGFILHCVFVLILVAGNVNSIVFSFIGLIITEMMPAVSILYCFDQRHPYKDKSGGSGDSRGSGGRNSSTTGGRSNKLSTIVSSSDHHNNNDSRNSNSPSEYSSNMTPTSNENDSSNINNHNDDQ